MKLLTRSEAHLQSNLYKKDTIDEGLKIAKSVDALRSDLANLEKQRQLFIENNQKIINDSIKGLLTEKENLIEENNSLKEIRKDLQKPLDEEWDKLKSEQKEFEKYKQDVILKEKEIDTRILEINTIKNNITNDEIRISNKLDSVTLLISEINEKSKQISTYLNETTNIYNSTEEYCKLKQKNIDNLERKLTYDIKHYQDFTQNLKDKERELNLRERKLNFYVNNRPEQ